MWGGDSVDYHIWWPVRQTPIFLRYSPERRCGAATTLPGGSWYGRGHASAGDAGGRVRGAPVDSWASRGPGGGAGRLNFVF